MKLAISMKSNFAFERLVAILENHEYGKEVEIYQKNVQTVTDVEDVVEFWKVDYIVVDSKVIDSKSICDFLNRNDIEFTVFESDFELVIEQILNFFSLQPSEEDPLQIKEVNASVIATKPPVEKKEKIIYQEKVVEKEVFKTSYTSIPNQLIVVGSMWSGAGSTTFAHNLAKAIAGRGLKVSYVEYPVLKPYTFDYLAIPVKEQEKEQEYVDVARELLMNRSFKKHGAVWNEHGVDWYVIDSRLEPIESFGYEEMLKFVYSINSTITIVDVSNRLNDPTVQSLLHHADHIYICIEPEPIKIDWLSTIKNGGIDAEVQREEKRAIDFLNEIEETEGVTYQFINMKYTKKIDTTTWLESLGDKKPLVLFPTIPYEDLIELTWKSEFLYDNEQYKMKIEKVLKPVLVQILPRQFYELPNNGVKKRSRFIPKIF